MKTFLVLFALLTLNSSNLFAQWQTDVRLSDFPISSRINPRVGKNIASNESIVHAVWDDARHSTEREIYYKRSTDDGISWGADTRLTNDPASSQLSTVAVSGNVVYVMWYDLRNGAGEIYYKRSIDAGLSWSDDIRLTNNAGVSSNPSVTISGQFVHVVWEDETIGNYKIYYKRSTDGGTSWESDVQLTNNSAMSWRPSVSVSGSVVHVVWTDNRDGANGEIYYKRSTDGGSSWEADTRLTNDASFSSNCSVNVSGQVVHVFWNDDRDGNFEIYYKRSTDEGAGWSTDIRLTNESNVSNYPSVTSFGSIIHVVWEDYRGNVSEIYYKHSTDGGLTWDEDTRLTNAGSFSMYPSVSVSDSVVHVLWEDFRDGAGAEIYYKRNPTGNPTAVENIESEFPSEFILAQNYPNPFNPTTSIQYAVGSHQFVTLKVYDLLGNEVATLVNEEKSSGVYNVNFDAAGLSSGMYLYKLQAGSFVETKKMILLR